MTLIHVVGIGLEGAMGLSQAVQQILARAALLIGSDRHLSYFPNYKGDRLILNDFRQAIESIRRAAGAGSQPIVILTSGDPLFFGLGRLLLAELPPDQLTFHPHLSSIQLAFNRVKVPWQDARFISAHGRSLGELIQALQQGAEKIAVLTDGQNTPQAIARLLRSLDLPNPYQLWVCENLGSAQERVQSFAPEALLDQPQDQAFALLNVVILLRSAALTPFELKELPVFGLADRSFFSFADRPGLITKREVRVLALAELALQPEQVIWDIGAGTGSVSIEIARLFPSSQIWAIEKTAAGISLIQQNCQRFQVKVTPIQGAAPEKLVDLPLPDRIFIGGSGGNLPEILDHCAHQLQPQGVMVLALATLENLADTLTWLKSQPKWESRVLQVQIARSAAIGSLTRLTPLNPVTLVTCCRN